MLYLTGTTLNIESFMGAIMSIGVSVSNSVHAGRRSPPATGSEGPPVHEAAVRGAARAAAADPDDGLRHDRRHGADVAGAGGGQPDAGAAGPGGHRRPARLHVRHAADPAGLLRPRHGQQQATSRRRCIPTTRRARTTIPRNRRAGDHDVTGAAVCGRRRDLPRWLREVWQLRTDLGTSTRWSTCLSCLSLAAARRLRAPEAGRPSRSTSSRTSAWSSRSGAPLRAPSASPASSTPMSRPSIYPKVAGYIEEWNVDIGDRIKKGQEIATLFVPELDGGTQAEEGPGRAGRGADQGRRAHGGGGEQQRGRRPAPRWRRPRPTSTSTRPASSAGNRKSSG